MLQLSRVYLWRQLCTKNTHTYENLTEHTSGAFLPVTLSTEKRWWQETVFQWVRFQLKALDLVIRAKMIVTRSGLIKLCGDHILNYNVENGQLQNNVSCQFSYLDLFLLNPGTSITEVFAIHVHHTSNPSTADFKLDCCCKIWPALNCG